MRPSALVLLLAAGVAGCAARHKPSESAAPPIAFDDLGAYHHAVTTRSPEAQRWFDQGLRLIYGFNHEEATRSFQEAVRLDPGCAMGWWGIALAAGPNYNDPGNRERDKRAYESLTHALKLRPHVSEPERAYIDALAQRYTKEPPPDRKALDVAYADAMREVAHRYPDDLDAATLFAEAMMDLRPWDLWTQDGRPQPGTEEIVTTLESVLARDPQHPGANHYYIHAVEASPHPERGLAAAGRLHDLVPGAGHLVHMPSHIYMRTGNYAEAVDANTRAVAVDEHYLERAKPAGLYPMMYYPHNIDFLWSAASMDGRSAETIRAARQLEAVGKAHPEMLRQMPDIEGVAVTGRFALARFGRWKEILAEPAPPEDLLFATGIHHYARGLALVRTGRPDDAAAELAALRKTIDATPPDRPLMQVNKQKDVLALASAVLAGELAAARGQNAEAVRDLEDAVRRQDALRYMEPPPWYYPVRQSLGAVLLSAGRAKEAEAVYREDLRRNPNNGWSLYGLAQALRAQKKNADAARVDEAFRRVWARADVELAASRF